MITVAEALERVLADTAPLGVDEISLADSTGRFAGINILASQPLPAFDFSGMDGYAVHVDDLASRDWLQVTGEQPAGPRRALSVSPGNCVRVFTGAPLPPGTGAVVMQEDVTREGDQMRFTQVPKIPTYQAGEFIRRRGSDLAAGQLIVRQGARLTAGRIGLLASQGFARLAAGRRPRVAILSTGSELRAVGETLSADGEIYNSNGPLLAAMLAEARLTATVSVHSVRDDLPATKSILSMLLAEHDVVIIVGGVSVGDHDLVKPALEDLGVRTDFWKVAVKPGKPFLYGRRAATQVFGLPGNPVSAFVTAFLFVLPALRKLAGAAEFGPTETHATLGVEWANRDGRPTYFRGNFHAPSGVFHPLGLQESHALHGLSLANALLPVPPSTTLPPQSLVQILLLHAPE